MDQKEAKTPKDLHIKNKKPEINIKVLMMSDSLSNLPEKQKNKMDKSGAIVRNLVEEKGYKFKGIEYIPDEKDLIANFVKKYIKDQNINLIITIGGTGVAERDISIETIEPLLIKKLPGFGELFRYLTFKEVGTVSMMTRAIAGINNKTIIICLPGSPNAVKLGVGLIFKEVVHILNHI